MKYIVEVDFWPSFEFDSLSKARKWLRDNAMGQARILKTYSWDDEIVRGQETLGNKRYFTITKIN